MLWPHSHAIANHFPIGHPSFHYSSSSTLNSGVFSGCAPEKVTHPSTTPVQALLTLEFFQDVLWKRKFSDHLLASKSQVGRRILSLMVKIARGFSFARPDFLTDSVSQIRNNLAYFKWEGPEAYEVPVSSKDLINIAEKARPVSAKLVIGTTVFLLRHRCEDYGVDELVLGMADACDGEAAAELGGGSLRVGSLVDSDGQAAKQLRGWLFW
uniref:Uncharacterized protein n=1 Tax=Brassica oleracea TaxID=3712 RepID=A0A3P6EZL7_BRAOL|nr:unnamed protein product [Brassica oleracea]